MLTAIHSERTLLSTFIKNHDILSKFVGMVKLDYFTTTAHKQVFNFIVDAFINGREISEDIIFAEFEEYERDVEEILLTTPATEKTIKYHIQHVKKALYFRTLLGKLQFAQEAIKNGEEIDIKQLFEDIEEPNTEIEFPTLEELISSLEEQLDKKKENPISTGIPSLDNKLFLSPGDFIIIGARPSMGKTGLMNTIALNLAKNNHGATIFSLEMPAEKIIARMLSNIGLIPIQEFNQGLFKDFNKYVKAKEDLKSLDKKLLVIDHLLDIDQIVQAIHYIRSNNPHIQDFFIDHLGHIKLNLKFNSEHLKINYITKKLKETAKSTGARIWLLSQLNRSVENRTTPRPMLSDLRESGSIEEVADVVLGLYRPSYYESKKKAEYQEPDPNELEILILKNRDGETGTVKTQFSGKYMKVGDELDIALTVEEITPSLPDMPINDAGNSDNENSNIKDPNTENYNTDDFDFNN